MDKNDALLQLIAELRIGIESATQQLDAKDADIRELRGQLVEAQTANAELRGKLVEAETALQEAPKE